MSNAVALKHPESHEVSIPSDVSVGALESALAMGDLSRLTPSDRLKYLAAICESVGLNPLTRPFEFISLQGKLTLYARRECTEQLRRRDKVSIQITERVQDGDLLIVRAKARTPDGREDESVGAVPCFPNTKGEALANAMMKAETKAKRRVTLSICGLGILDESEVDSVNEDRRSRGLTEVASTQDKIASLNAEIAEDEAPEREFGEAQERIERRQAESAERAYCDKQEAVDAKSDYVNASLDEMEKAETEGIRQREAQWTSEPPFEQSFPDDPTEPVVPEKVQKLLEICKGQVAAVLEWLRTSHDGRPAWLDEYQGLEDLPEKRIDSILAKPNAFLRHVQKWKATA